MRRRLVAGLLSTVLLGGCGMPDEQVTSGSTTTAAPGAGWEQLPPSPLSPRGGAVLTALEEGGLLVVGGDMVAGCLDHRTAPDQDQPANEPAAASSGASLISTSALSCVAPEYDPRLRDGAILESATGEWKRIADAPAPLSDASGGVVIGDAVYYLSWPSVATDGAAQGTWMSYDVSDDAWKTLAPPPVGGRVVKAGDRIIAFPGSEERGPVRDVIYDPSTDSWSELPRDPLSPSYDRFMVWTGREVVLLGNELVSNPGAERPSLARAAAFDPETERWRRLPDSAFLGSYDHWWWAGGKVVNPFTHSADGGETNKWARDHPYGGMLDPASGEWSELPAGSPRPADCDETSEPFEADVRYQAGGPETVVRHGLALHVAAGRWEAVPCNPPQADFNSASTWAFGGVVAFGGYDEFYEPGQLRKYEFSNTGWLWRPSGG